jgi:hypothetical protein
MGWDRWKKVFYWGAAIWLSGTIAMRIARTTSWTYSTLLLIDNVGTIIAVIEIPIFVLGIVLFCRWAWFKFQGVEMLAVLFPRVPGCRVADSYQIHPRIRPQGGKHWLDTTMRFERQRESCRRSELSG